MRRLDIGMASHKAPEKLNLAIQELVGYSVTDWRLHLIHNPSEGDEATREVIARWATQDHRIAPLILPENVGYAGAVNHLFRVAETEYIAYLDNDAYIQTAGWDEKLCEVLDRYHEVGVVFPNGGAYPLDRPGYTEVLWSPGFCFAVSRLAMKDTGLFDETLGHQEEADWFMRLRMAGYRCAAHRGISVRHDATATSDPTATERINRGVVKWVSKWNAYFNGKNFNYHSPNVTRFEDWPPTALYLEEYWRKHLNGLNAAPERIEVDNRPMDLIKVPRWPGMYVGRYI